MLNIYEWSLLKIIRKATGTLTAVIAAIARAVQFQASPFVPVHASSNPRQQKPN